MGQIIESGPYWLLEVLYSLGYAYQYDDAEWVFRLGMKEEQARELIRPFQTLREELRRRGTAVIARYSGIAGYIHLEPEEIPHEDSKETCAPICTFVRVMRDAIESETPLSGEENQFLLNCAYDGFLYGQEGEGLGQVWQKPRIQGISDVMCKLERWKNDRDKFEFSRMYLESDRLVELLRNLKKECDEIGRECEPLIREELATFRREFDGCRDPHAFEELFGISIGGYRQIVVSPWLLCMNQFSGTDSLPQNAGGREEFLRIQMGIRMFDLLRLGGSSRSDEDLLLVNVLKAIGDATRIKILRLLAQRPMYLQEIADAVGLKPATISHHLDTLFVSDLIEMAVGERKRTCYKLKAENFERVGGKVSGIPSAQP